MNIAEVLARIRNLVKRCRYCNRVLTSKESKKLGYGKTCAKKNEGILTQEELERRGQLRIPGVL